jgi:hypothetical protein
VGHADDGDVHRRADCCSSTAATRAARGCSTSSSCTWSQ